jgi:hypothetical protein
MPNDLKQLSRDLRRLRREITDTTNRATSQVARETVSYAKRLSSGPILTATLIEWDHPYAKRHGSVQRGLDASVINRQTGLFYRSWTIYYLPTPSGMVVPVVRNNAPYAKYLETGTSKMFARPMGPRLEFFAERTWERIAPPLFEAALSRTAFAR